MLLKLPKQFYLFLGLLFVINIIQSSITELLFDESYYWYYAQNMAWGYFDHPPIVALLIKLGSFISKSELGVRLMSCLLGVGTALLLWYMIEDEKKKDNVPLFFILLFSMPLINAYGFFTLPDTPLLFFTALFLFLYKRFLKKENVLTALLLGATMAAMMYSKYHGALIIIFVLCSNIKLFTNKLAWLAVVFSLLLYSPHLIWLYENEFATIIFHISERPNQAYNFEGFTLGYLLNLIAIFGLSFPWVYWALFKAKSIDKFQRALLFLTYGFILFFFFSSFNRRTQAQWIITICIPLVVITYNFLLQRANIKKWFLRVGVLSMVLLFYARVWLVYQPLFPMTFETHGNKAFIERIQNEVGDIPVIFENSYRTASMFHFYSGKASYSLNNLFYRHNQYSIDNSEQNIQGKRVAYLSKYYPAKDFKITAGKSSLKNGTFFNEFRSYRKLKCFIDETEVHTKTNTLALKVFNPYEYDVPTNELTFFIGYMNAHKEMKTSQKLKIKNESSAALKAKDTTLVKVNILEPKFNEYSFIRIGIAENTIPPGLNSKPYPINANGL